MVWGRYSKIKGAKPGVATVTKQGALWTIKGRLDSVAPGTEGDWVAIDGVVERITANNIQIRGEVAFRVAKVQNGTPCKAGGLLHFRRSGKSQVWRLAEGDNPCDGTQEMFDLAYEKPAEKGRCRPRASALNSAPTEGGQRPGNFAIALARQLRRRVRSRRGRVALDPVPFELVRRARRVEPLPQIDILDRLLVGGLPAVLLPAVDPLGDAVPHVLLSV